MTPKECDPLDHELGTPCECQGKQEHINAGSMGFLRGGRMCFFFHDWTKWSEPYTRDGVSSKWQDRLCQKCRKIETRLT